MVEDEDIHLTISTFNASLDVVGEQLVQLANEHGGRDNISVQLAHVLDSFTARKGLLNRLTGLFGS
jgi:protein phosphatase